MDDPSGILLEEESYAIRGAVFEVYSQLGAGFAEPVYQEALEMELALRGIPFEAQKQKALVKWAIRKVRLTHLEINPKYHHCDFSENLGIQF